MRWILLYSAAIGSAELAYVCGHPIGGLLLHALALAGLLNHYAFRSPAPECDSLLVLALLPLARMASVVMPIHIFPPIYWYVFSGTPLLIAIWWVARRLPRPWLTIGFRRGQLWQQGLIALTGLPFSLLLHWWLRPPLLQIQTGSSQLSWQTFLLAAVISFGFVGFLEELIFRGLLQQTLVDAYGPVGVVVSSLLFALMYTSMGSWGYILFMAGIGLSWGWCVYQTNTLWGVVVAHGLFQWGLLFLWPRFLNFPSLATTFF